MRAKLEHREFNNPNGSAASGSFGAGRRGFGQIIPKSWLNT